MTESSLGYSKSDNTHNIVEILKKQHQNRSETELNEIIKYMKEVQFFKERIVKDSDYPLMIEAMKYEFF
jgi:translation initiation factor IF-2